MPGFLVLRSSLILRHHLGWLNYVYTRQYLTYIYNKLPQAWCL